MFADNFESEIVRPEPSRLLEGLRDTGYDFNTAVADIVDNSIAAEAKNVIISAKLTISEGVRVSIADDGFGMGRSALLTAMRYGAPARAEKHSLGKFGLGLKTASTACCRRLKVISRDIPGAEVHCAVWDLDYISQVAHDWVVLFEEPTPDDLEDFATCARGGTGTLVVWEKCDRLLPARYKNHQTDAYRAAFEKSITVLRQHLSMVYQRFLDPNYADVSNISIRVNEWLVEPWDPFCKEIEDAYGDHGFLVETTDDDGRLIQGEVRVKAYIVPSTKELRTDEEKRRVFPSHNNIALNTFRPDSLSGFYVYRENRLIHWGDWFGISVDFHNRLCRFELSFSADLDESFQVDIKKSRILIDRKLRDELEEFARPLKKEGERRYRQTARKTAAKVSKGLHEDANSNLEQAQSSVNVRSKVATDNSGKTTLSNKFGKNIAPYEIVNSGDGFPVKVEESLEDGLLWSPAIIDGKPGVLLNANHVFYQRFYGTNRDNKNAVQAMDAVFLALAQAESSAWQPSARDSLEEERYEASRILRKYANDLPDVSTEDFERE